MTGQRIESQVSKTTVGGYPILEKVGVGGMGSVYKAENPMTGKLVAIKVVTNAVLADEVARMRFAQECQVARGLNHPNIVTVLDFGLDGSKPYLVMEYVDGESLGQRLEREGRLPEATAVQLIGQVGNALHWAHSRRLIHRDVKPDNILITAAGQAKLSDLGLVKNLEGDLNLTQTQSCIGTPNFMAPEQFEDARKADARSDLYSLAATLYMTVTGQLPFKSRSAKAVMAIYKKKLAGDLTPPRQLVPELSAELETEILRALHPVRDERQASVREFVERLTATLAPAAPTRPERPRRPNKRATERFISERTTACKPLQRFADRAWSGQVRNISQSGLCLELSRRFEPGALLTVVLEGPESSRRTVVARVMWVRQDVPKKWTLGCQFDRPLCEFEVEGLR